jgi:hypothetical protein
MDAGDDGGDELGCDFFLILGVERKWGVNLSRHGRDKISL